MKTNKNRKVRKNRKVYPQKKSKVFENVVLLFFEFVVLGIVLSAGLYTVIYLHFGIYLPNLLYVTLLLVAVLMLLEVVVMLFTDKKR
jgi:hypothetical protein